MSTHWILHMREAWWCDSGMQGSLCILFTFCISSVWRNFHGNSSGNRLFAVSGNIFTHQATEARYTDEVNMFHGKGGGLVVPGIKIIPNSNNTLLLVEILRRIQISLLLGRVFNSLKLNIANDFFPIY